MRIIWIASLAALLGACSNGDSAVRAEDLKAASGSAASAPASTSIQSSNGKLALTPMEGSFHDALANAPKLVEGVAPEKLLFLARDAERDITLYAVDAGVLKTDGKAYFDKLSKNLSADKTLTQLKTSTASERLNYHFTQNGLNESCAALTQAKQAYVVCATSANAGLDTLDAQLQNIQLR